MSNIDTLIELQNDGRLIKLVKAGLFPSKTYLHMNIYLFVNSKINQGYRSKDAIGEATQKFNLDRSNIYRAIKSFR